MSDDQVLEGIWARLSEVAVKGAQYDSRERQPHPKCLKGTRVDLLKYIHELLDDPEKNQLIWLHGTAGVGKSAAAFTVAEKMRGLKVTEETNVEKRLAGTFFFSRKHTKRSTAGYFFATLVYQLATNFPNIRKDVSRIIRDNPALLDPDTSLRDQMEALFLRPLRKLQLRLQGCPPLSFVVDALDECTSEPELTDLILSLAQALREPDLPVTHILLTSRSESHISKVFQHEEVGPLVREIPVKISGEGIGTIISLDGDDVDNDIFIFLQHSFKFGELASRHPDFPQPSRDELVQLASRAGRRFIVASTMMKFIIDDEDNDPHDRLQLMLQLTSKLLPGTEVHKLYDCILSTCTDPKRAYMHLSIVAALADPLPISQISALLGPGLGRDVQATLIQLRSVMDIPTDAGLPVNIYHSSIRDYVSDSSNCSLPQVHHMQSPHSLLAYSSLRLMMKEIPESTGFLDALSELKKQSQAMRHEDPRRLKDSLAFLVRSPEPVSVLICMLWLRGYRTSDVRCWLETADGGAWLQTQNGRDWLQALDGRHWLQTQAGHDWLWTGGGHDWLRTQAGRDWLQKEEGHDWLQKEAGQDWLQTQAGRDWLQTQGGQDWLQTRAGQDWIFSQEGREWLRTRVGREWWLQTQAGRDWLQAQGARNWLQTQGARDWLQTQGGRHWLQTRGGRHWLQTRGGRDWLQTRGGRDWLQTRGGRDWLQTKGGQDWLQTQAGQDWLQTQAGRHWLLTRAGREWMRSQGGRDWLLTRAGREWMQSQGGQDWLLAQAGREWWLQLRVGRDWLQAQGGRDWLQTQAGRDWLQAQGGRDWLQTYEGQDWLQCQGGQDWLQTQGGQDWLQTQGGQDWLQTKGGRVWLQGHGGRVWLQTQGGRDWLLSQGGRDWLQTQAGRDWLPTQSGRDWLPTQSGRDWLLSQAGREWWLQTRAGQGWLQTPAGQYWLQSPDGRDWLRTQEGCDWLQTRTGQGWLQAPGGLDWLQTPGGRGWLQTLSGRGWLQTPHAQAWQSTPAASVLVPMEEFSSTLEAVSEYIIVPELHLLPTFQVIQQFKSFPDFLMFPIFLVLMPRDHSTTTLPKCHLSPDRKIIRAMNVFTTFANKAQERCQSASDALKYACQNWVVHLSRAPNLWDDTLNHIFQAFWNRHLLSWLERQWCLKGLRSCLDILSEGQKLAKVERVNTQHDEGLSAIGPDFRHSTSEASAPASTPETMRGPSTPTNTLPTGELIMPLHVGLVPNARPIKPISRCPPSTSRPAPPLPPVPYMRSNAAVFHIGTSRKRTSDEFQINNDSPFESGTPGPPKRRK